VVALGHAYGNTVARTLATARPDLVRGVILVAASGRAPLSDDIKRAIAKASDLTLPEAERTKYLAEGYFAPGADPSVWLSGWHPEVQAAQMRAYANSNSADYVPAGGKMPILDIQGADDVIIPRPYSADLQHELGARVTLVVIPHAAHALVPEQPAAVAEAIGTWMARFSTPGASPSR
jgi:pimeloyl-ACP methyl ester carboxylesterase